LEAVTGLYICDDADINAVQIANAVKCAEYTKYYLCGNESINLGFVSSEDTLIKAINDLRSALKKAGYGDIPVGTNEVMSYYSDRLLDVCDFLCISYHPYFGGATAGDAGKLWFPQHLDRAIEKAKGKPVIVGESGWPSYAGSGESKEKARREAAIYNMWAVYHARKKGVTLFNFVSHDEDWKIKYGPVETAFGIFEQTGVCKLKYPEMFWGKGCPCKLCAGDCECLEGVKCGHVDCRWCGPPPVCQCELCAGDCECTIDIKCGHPECDLCYGAPKLEITQWPSEENNFYVQGKVTGVDPTEYRLSVWIRVGNIWYAKPTWDDFVQFIRLDGSFSISTYSHSGDYNQTNCAVLLIKASDADKLNKYDYAESKKFAVLFAEK